MSEEGSVTSQCTGQQQRENLSSFSACYNYRCPACHTTRCPDCTAAGWAQAHLWERVGFMELMEFMGGCMGSFPGGSFCRLFWWRSSKSRPSSSHHDDSSAVQTEQMTVSTHLRNQHSPVQVQDTNRSHKPNRQTSGVQSLSMNHHSHYYTIKQSVIALH